MVSISFCSSVSFSKNLYAVLVVLAVSYSNVCLGCVVDVGFLKFCYISWRLKVWSFSKVLFCFRECCRLRTLKFCSLSERVRGLVFKVEFFRECWGFRSLNIFLFRTLKFFSVLGSVGGGDLRRPSNVTFSSKVLEITHSSILSSINVGDHTNISE